MKNKSDLPNNDNYISDDLNSGSKILIKPIVILFIAFTLIISNTVFYILGMNYIPIVDSSTNESKVGIENVSESREVYRKISKIKSMLYKHYNGNVDIDKLNDQAIKGMVNSLGDNYTFYMNQEEYSGVLKADEETYLGIGVQIVVKDDRVVIMGVFNDSPAKKAGIRVGDKLIKVDDREVSSSDLDEVILLLKSSEDAPLKLQVERDGEILEFEVYQGYINRSVVESFIVEDGIGYIKLNSFTEGATSKIKDVLKEFKVNGVHSIIFDVRQNKGGLLNECIDISSQFLKQDSVIVSTEDKYGKKEVFVAEKGIGEDLNIVVLGDSGSASASEVLIGALIDNERAVFVGDTTFGKGLVQSFFEFDDGSAIRITISKYFTPNGDDINQKGINPNVKVDYSAEQYFEYINELQDERDVLLKKDPQFKEALEILKGKS